jgi:hypothetical protein
MNTLPPYDVAPMRTEKCAMRPQTPRREGMRPSPGSVNVARCGNLPDNLMSENVA